MIKDDDIQSLAKTFREHAKQSEINRQAEIEDFKKNYPDSPVPEYMTDNFNIAEALAIICEEILHIKSAARV